MTIVEFLNGLNENRDRTITAGELADIVSVLMSSDLQTSSNVLALCTAIGALSKAQDLHAAKLDERVSGLVDGKIAALRLELLPHLSQ